MKLSHCKSNTFKSSPAVNCEHCFYLTSTPTFLLPFICFTNFINNKENHQGNPSDTSRLTTAKTGTLVDKEVKSCLLRYVRVLCIRARQSACACLCVCVCLRVHVFDLRVEYLGMSHHSLMFPFSSAGTLELLLADLFASCEVPVMHSQSKVTDL